MNASTNGRRITRGLASTGDLGQGVLGRGTERPSNGVMTRAWILCAWLSVCQSAAANDWPMYRFDAGRRGATKTTLPESMSLVWSRQLPELTPAFKDARLQFDAGYEPIVAGGILLIASSRTDSVCGYDARTGEERWRFFANGPVRLAPAVSGQNVCFGSDDGYLYCLDLATGSLRWKQQAVPSHRRLIGNRRLISVWPVRGGPVVQEGVVYFAAGVWPFEGVFVYAMKIDTGEVLWRNDRLGYLFGKQPHNTEAIGGLAPQGYLLLHGDELIVPCSNAYPARLNRQTGELISFELPTAGRYPGGWFAALDPDKARAIRRGQLTFDEVVNRHEHEGGLSKSRGGVAGLSREIRTASETLSFDTPREGVEGTVHSMAIADGALYVTTRSGQILCFRRVDEEAEPSTWEFSPTPLTYGEEARAMPGRIKANAASQFGIAIVVGLTNGEQSKALIESTNYHVVVFDDDRDRVEKLRRELTDANLYGHRAAVIHCRLQDLELPPYITSTLTSERPDISLQPFLQTLRPFGGIAMGGSELSQQQVSQEIGVGNFSCLNDAVTGTSLVRRVGALPGATQYSGDFAASPDELVRFPLGVLWFDDALAHFKRSPQPVFDRGTMVSRPKDWHVPRHTQSNKIDYPLLTPVLSDIYTGRVLDESERPRLRASLLPSSASVLEPSQYRPEGAPFASKSTPRQLGQRINPLTGESESRVFPKTYGCDGGVDYGSLFTLRSGTAAYYDKTIESGTVFLSGPRSGCTNSIIPSGGLLNVPYYYEGCTCSYPLPTAMSLVAMPERHEQWSSWGESEVRPGSIRRIGINFGAPGDRMTRDGTLWLDYPSVGGPSPKVHVEVTGAINYRYRHSVWMRDSEPCPWVSASIATGLERCVIKDLRPGNYQVRLYFAEPEPMRDSGSVRMPQSVKLQGQTVLDDFDAVEQAGGRARTVVKSFANVNVLGELTLELTAERGRTVISGIELIEE